MTDDEIVDDLINWSSLSLILSGKPQNVRKDYVTKTYRRDVARIRSTLKNWLIYTEIFNDEEKNRRLRLKNQ
jgi:hypothetical protein